LIRLIEALNFRSLRYVSQPLERFHVLVGPNASGKTTFLDVVDFLGNLLADGLQNAIRRITPDPRDLLFNHTGENFELAVEAQLPNALVKFHKLAYEVIRYEIAIGVNAETGVPVIQSERVLFVRGDVTSPQRHLFPEINSAPDSLVGKDRYRRKTKQIAGKNEVSGKDNFYPEIKRGTGGGWVPSFQLGNQKSAFANLPEDEERFPAATWFKNFLTEGIQKLVLDSLEMRKASPPGQVNKFAPDGVNLPWVIEDLRVKHPLLFADWVGHLRTALSDLQGISTVEREDTRHRHLVIHYDSGIDVPSWMVSDGTLRLLALTLPAYLPDFEGVLLIEEPENGIHPRAVDTVFQSLSSVYGAQVLLATHSPVVLNAVNPRDVLCFAKDPQGGTDIVRGDMHPLLVNWQHETSMGTLLAAGVLG
jgi:hypothetical protein